jgi:CheY-like chemotaxis protein
LSRILKEDPQSTHVSVVIATAHVMSGDRERFMRESKADGFLRKPVVDPQELLSLIARLTSDAAG